MPAPTSAPDLPKPRRIIVTSDAIGAQGSPLYSRRGLFKAGAALGSGLLIARALGSQRADASGTIRAAVPTGPRTQVLHLAGTDGWASMPASSPKGSFWPDSLAPQGSNVYIFGFRNVSSYPDDQVITQRGKAQISAPVLGFDQFDPSLGTSEADNNAVRITLSNLGLSVRPDLTDGHTIHWHGFTNAIPLFDGVPELSISVPIGRSFTYYYRPYDPGTYMYHCHFEDVEHVQMGMTGVVYVRPLRNTATEFFAYDHASTQYDREYSFMLTELWVEAHYRDAHIQTTDWTDFKPSFWLLNGRAYPDTLQPSSEPAADTDPMQADGAYSLKYNPISSLVAAKPGERVLLRMSNLGYQHHAMTLDGLPMRVIAKDAACLVDENRDLTYETNTVEVGPGESRDVIVTIPSGEPSGPYTAHRLYDRNYAYLSNGGDAGYGGMATEVRVYPTSTPQSLFDSFKQTV
jgi:FtsP/CotA-like multicopper oxidase with cupredoxin domain